MLTFLIAKAVQLLSHVTGAGVKTATGVGRDLTGMQKDRVDTEIARRKLAELESPIQKATMAEIYQFDPTYKSIERKVQKDFQRQNRLLVPIPEMGLAAALTQAFLFIRRCVRLPGRRWGAPCRHLLPARFS